MADMIDYQKLLEMWRDEKQRRQMAEGELSIVKGIGNNSPEMKAAKVRIKELLEINKEHQQTNGKLHSELEIEEYTSLVGG